MKPFGLGLLILASLLAACSTASIEPSLSPTASPPPSPKGAVVVSTPIKMDTAQPPFNMSPSPPVEGTPREMPAPGVPPKVRRTPLPFPQPGDVDLQEGKTYLKSVTVETAAGGKVLLGLEGDLPTPCHQLRVAVERREGKLLVRVYSVANPREECVQVLKSFSTEVKLGPFPDGNYRVIVNGKEEGTVTVKH